MLTSLSNKSQLEYQFTPFNLLVEHKTYLFFCLFLLYISVYFYFYHLYISYRSVNFFIIMRSTLVFLALSVYIILCSTSSLLSSSPAVPSDPRPLMIISDVHLTAYSWIQLMFFLLLVIIYSFRKWLFICSSAVFLPFNVARNSLSRWGPPNQITYNDLPTNLSLLVSLFLLCELDIVTLIAFFFHCSPQNIFQLNCMSRQLMRRPILMNLILMALIFSMAVSQISHLLCVLLLILKCSIEKERTPNWVYQLLLILANDIHLNPGPRGYQNGFLKFMNYNLNSLAKDNFSRVQLLEAHNSIFDYDIISLCETGLNSSNESLVPKIEGYTFLSANHPDDVTHGGVGVYYKDSLPVILRDDLSFNESIVLELRVQRKKIFFTVLYRSPSHTHNTPQFKEFLENFKNLHTNICSENPYAMFFTGDFNGHSQTWWPAGNTNVEGREIEELFWIRFSSRLI